MQPDVGGCADQIIENLMFDSSKINDQAFNYYARLARLRRYFDSHYSESISLADAARVVGLEKTYFSDFFHQKAGICFKDWIRHQRVCKACALIRSQNHSITTIAFAVGFRDLGTFERAFKRFTGKTPRAFKTAVLSPASPANPSTTE